MFKYRFNLLSLLGFPIRVDASWFLVAILVTWSLAAGLFPEEYPGHGAAAYWVMGVAGMLGLFASIVLHELSHALTARLFGMPISGITLFIFGGVAELRDEPPHPKAELLVAAAGPAASMMIAAACYGAAGLVTDAGAHEGARAVLTYLALINTVLVLFNTIPAFPLDGGRVLRALLWRARGNLAWATRVSTWIGAAFGYLLILLGIVSFATGSVLGGLWWFFIGLFLARAANMAYQQVLVRREFEGESIQQFMRGNPDVVAPGTSIRALVDQYFYTSFQRSYPVIENGRLIGCVALEQVKDLPQEEWDRRTVRDLLTPCSGDNVIGPESDALAALNVMNQSGNSQLLVVENGRLRGTVALCDLLRTLSLRLELREPGRKHRRARA